MPGTAIKITGGRRNTFTNVSSIGHKDFIVLDEGAEDNAFHNVHGIAAGVEIPKDMLVSTAKVLTEGNGNPKAHADVRAAAKKTGLCAWATSNGVGVAQLITALAQYFKSGG